MLAPNSDDEQSEVYETSLIGISGSHQPSIASVGSSGVEVEVPESDEEVVSQREPTEDVWKTPRNNTRPSFNSDSDSDEEIFRCKKPTRKALSYQSSGKSPSNVASMRKKKL
jgi:hypothetical protein